MDAKPSNPMEPPVKYLDIGMLRNCVMELFCGGPEKARILPHSLQEALIGDYIFMSMFVGNDFIPPIECLRIRANGIDTVLSTYSTLQAARADRSTLNTLTHRPKITNR